MVLISAMSGSSASDQVETIVGYGDHLLVGGYFKSINDSSADPYMASLNPGTGKDDGFVHLNISGNYNYPGVGNNPTRVYNQQLGHGGTLDLVEGDFTSVGGVGRQQIFMLNLAGATATVTGWSSPEFDGSKGNVPGGYPYQCTGKEPFYIQAASWSPSDSTIYTASTGYRPYNQQSGTYPETGLCDAAAAFPATQSEVTHLWVNYTGCDSLYSTAADASTVYFGGHERWSENPDGCDFAGSGAIPAPGMEGLSPSSGQLTFNPTRGRGLGADDMLLTSAGLWIASDNAQNTSKCGGAGDHSGICFLLTPDLENRNTGWVPGRPRRKAGRGPAGRAGSTLPAVAGPRRLSSLWRSCCSTGSCHSDVTGSAGPGVPGARPDPGSRPDPERSDPGPRRPVTSTSQQTHSRVGRSRLHAWRKPSYERRCRRSSARRRVASSDRLAHG